MNLREIDRLVAEKVMGLKIDDYYFVLDEKGLREGELLNYSTNIEDAWQVVEKLDVEEFSISKFGKEYHVWVETELGGEGFLIKSKTAPLAICLAALKAVGVEVNIK
jgi:Phage ABA sandwich domain